LPKTIILVALGFISAGTSGATAAYVVHTSDIANGAVTHAKLADNSVWHADVGSSSVQANNLDWQTKTHLAIWFRAFHTGAILQQSGGIKQVAGYDYTLPVAGAGLQSCAIVATGQTPEEIGVSPDPAVAYQLDVTPGDTESDFSVAVYCPARMAGESAYASATP
jgi:hypothetical protein